MKTPIPESLYTDLLVSLRIYNFEKMNDSQRRKWLGHGATDFIDAYGLVGVNPDDLIKIWYTLQDATRNLHHDQAPSNIFP